jgi:uncharacterized membrane protein
MAPIPERTHPVSRLEGFSDAVFGFALTLLVVQLEVPRSSEALLLLVRGSVPFALTFAMVCYIWWEHNRFFRLTGMQDAWTAFLNCSLLFVVLFYVYPLKFLTTTLLGPLVGLPGTGDLGDGRFVMLVYSSGVVLIFALFLLLYRHARVRRATLGLTPADQLQLRYKGRAHGISAGLGIASVALAAFVPERQLWIPGVLYGLMGPLHGWNGYRAGRAHRRLLSGDS